MSDLNSNIQDSSEKETKETDAIQEDAAFSWNEKSESMTSLSIDPEPEKEAASSPNGKKTTLAKELLDYIEVFAFAIGIVILLFSFCFRLCQVKGDSMKNTLLDGEALIVSHLFYTPSREDIIVFHQTGALNEPVVKRVIATAGETVQIKHSYQTMVITITDTNGKQTVLEEDYMKYDGMPLYLRDMTVTVPEGYLFVLGDNRNDSKDSRHSDIGLVDERRVLGKVLFRVAPFSRFGAVE